MNGNDWLLGARISLAPWDIMEFGLNRTALFGGSKDPSFVLSEHTPFASGKVYLEYAFSDISAFWQPEDRHDNVFLQPLKDSYLAGLMLTTGDTDITLEYVATSRCAYSGGGEVLIWPIPTMGISSATLSVIVRRFYFFK